MPPQAAVRSMPCLRMPAEALATHFSIKILEKRGGS